MVHSVIVFGSSGNAGSCIVNGLLNYPDKFKVFAAVRPESLEKSSVKSFEEKGATIIPITIDSPKDVLLSVLKGKDIVVSAVSYTQIYAQAALASLAKKVGVQRFVPCDFGTPGVKGTRLLLDLKLKIHDHIEDLGLGHTYIDMGWWMQNNLPSRNQEKSSIYPEFVTQSSRYLFTDETHRNIYTDLRDLITFIGPILDDPRTLNNYVLIWGEEATQKQVLELYHKVTGERVDIIPKTNEEVQRRIDNSPNELCVERNMWEYLNDMWVRGDNTVVNARKPEYGSALDAKELYPDLPVRTLEAYAKEFF